MRVSGGIDDGGGNIFRSVDVRRNGDLRKNRLDFVGDELVFDESGNEGGFVGIFVVVDVDVDWRIGLVDGGLF